MGLIERDDGWRMLVRPWERADVFHEIWRRGLLDDDEAVGIDWSFLGADKAMTKAPLGGAQTGPNPTDRGKKGRDARFSARHGGYRSLEPPTKPRRFSIADASDRGGWPLPSPPPLVKSPARRASLRRPPSGRLVEHDLVDI